MCALAAWTRGAVSASSHRMSAGDTKCHVGRRRCPQYQSFRERGLDALVGRPANPQAERPFRTEVVLRLHRREPFDRCERSAQRDANEPLARQAAERDLADHDTRPLKSKVKRERSNGPRASESFSL